METLSYMSLRGFGVCLVILAAAALTAFAQSDRGTVTGTVADPAGAVVANAVIQMKHVETGAVYEAGSTSTGNYTIGQLPSGTYELSVTVPGFKKYVRQNIRVEVAQTLRLDIGLEVGSATESITVTEEVSLLKTESGELSHTVTGAKLDELPILGTGAQNSSTCGQGVSIAHAPPYTCHGSPFWHFWHFWHHVESVSY